MKVLHIVDKMNPSRGGVCQAIRTIIKGLSAKGFQNEVICLDDPTASFISNDPFTIHGLGPTENLWSYSAKLKNWFKSNISKFDIIISHGLWQYPGFAGYKVWRNVAENSAFKAKFYVMPHGMLDPYFQNSTSRKLKAIRNLVYWKLIEEQIINGADGILFTCTEEERLAQETFNPYEPKKTFVVSLGVESPPPFSDSMTKILKSKYPQVNNRPYILFLSRVHEKKGVDLLIKAYANLFRLSKDREFDKIPSLLIAGPGMETIYGRQLIQLLEKEKLPKDLVKFVGMLEGESKWGAFYHCDAFILPSHQENYGIAVVEALACGKPVLISNQVNIWKEIKTSGAALVSDVNIEAIQGMLSEWIKLADSKKSEMGKNAKDAFDNKFTVKSATQKLVKVIIN